MGNEGASPSLLNERSVGILNKICNAPNKRKDAWKVNPEVMYPL